MRQTVFTKHPVAHCLIAGPVCCLTVPTSWRWIGRMPGASGRYPRGHRGTWPPCNHPLTIRIFTCGAHPRELIAGDCPRPGVCVGAARRPIAARPLPIAPERAWRAPSTLGDSSVASKDNATRRKSGPLSGLPKWQSAGRSDGSPDFAKTRENKGKSLSGYMSSSVQTAILAGWADFGLKLGKIVNIRIGTSCHFGRDFGPGTVALFGRLSFTCPLFGPAKEKEVDHHED